MFLSNRDGQTGWKQKAKIWDRWRYQFLTLDLEEKTTVPIDCVAWNRPGLKIEKICQNVGRKTA